MAGATHLPSQDAVACSAGLGLQTGKLCVPPVRVCAGGSHLPVQTRRAQPAVVWCLAPVMAPQLVSWTSVRMQAAVLLLTGRLQACLIVRATVATVLGVTLGAEMKYGLTTYASERPEFPTLRN